MLGYPGIFLVSFMTFSRFVYEIFPFCLQNYGCLLMVKQLSYI